VTVHTEQLTSFRHQLVLNMRVLQRVISIRRTHRSNYLHITVIAKITDEQHLSVIQEQ